MLNPPSEHLQGIPENLEARISEKRFLSAVELLQDALKSMKKSNMDEIGALSDLRVYLSNQEHVCFPLPLCRGGWASLQSCLT
jgi:hypothetical protein